MLLAADAGTTVAAATPITIAAALTGAASVLIFILTPFGVSMLYTSVDIPRGMCAKTANCAHETQNQPGLHRKSCAGLLFGEREHLGGGFVVACQCGAAEHDQRARQAERAVVAD